MRTTWIFLISFIALAVISDVNPSKWKSKSKYRYGSNRYYTRHSGLSSTQKSLLFASAGALAGIYIGSRMRPSVHLRSYRDLDGFEVCEGSRIDVTDGLTRSYKYFLCPDDPNSRFERYCCRDTSTHSGFCCSYDVKMREHYERKTILGSVFGGITLIVLVSVLVYCCCCRQRRNKSIAQPAVYTTDPIATTNTMYKPDVHPPPYRSGYDATPCPYPPTNPASVPGASYPVNPPPVNPAPAGMPQPGSGWGAALNANTNPPPPPYPGNNPVPSAPADYKTYG